MDALDLTDGDHRYRLLSHIRALLRLPTITAGFGMALAAAAAWLSCPESHNDVSTLLPWQLLWSWEAASPEHPYTWFTMSPEFARHTLAGADPSEMAGWAILTTDTRYDDTCDFAYSILATMLDQPTYGLWSLDWCIPLKPPLTPHGDLPALDWALHSLCGLILETWQQTHHARYRPPPLGAHGSPPLLGPFPLVPRLSIFLSPGNKNVTPAGLRFSWTLSRHGSVATPTPRKTLLRRGIAHNRFLYKDFPFLPTLQTFSSPLLMLTG